MKIIENVELTFHLERGTAIDLKNQLFDLFINYDISKDALFIDKERVLKGRLTPNEMKLNTSGSDVDRLTILSAINAIRSNVYRYCKEISTAHTLISRSKYTDSGEFEGIFFKFQKKELENE